MNYVLAAQYVLATIVCIVGAAVFFLPSFLGHFRHAAAIRNITALNSLALLTLVCSFALWWSLLATGVIWGTALVLALGRRRLIAQLGSAPNGGSAAPLGKSGASSGRPSVS